MSELKSNQIQNIENSDSKWKGIYIIGAIAAMLSMLVGMFDIIASFLPGGEFSGCDSVLDWFKLLHSNSFIALRNLDFPYLFIAPLGILVFFALYAAHRKVNKPYTTLVLIIFLVGTTIRIINIKALPLLALSNQYFVATTETEKSLLLAAGKALLAIGESHSPGTFIEFFLQEIAFILMCLIMLRSKIFNKLTSLTGIVGFSCLLFFLVVAVFIPVLSSLGEIIVMFGGILGMIWYVLIIIRLLQLGWVNKNKLNHAMESSKQNERR